MKIIADLLLRALILLLATKFVPGFHIDSFTTALLAAIVLAILNFFIKPVLILLTLPVNILTLGLFTFVVNAILLYMTSALVSGFRIESFITAIVAALVIAILSGIFSIVFKV